MKLKKLLKDVEVISLIGSDEVEILAVEYDSRKVENNSLFICINGSNINSHIFIEDCKKRGAVCFLIEEDVDYEEGYTYVKVRNTNVSMSIIANNFYDNPSKKINLIGVTGTNGKTSIATFLREIFKLKCNCGFIGTTCIDDGENLLKTDNTTPNNIEIQKNLYNMIQNNCEYCFMEVSSHALSLNRVDNLQYNIGIFTNLTEDHLDYHKTFEEYRKAKEKLFYKTTDKNIINIDDINGRIILDNIRNLKIPYYTYGMNNTGTFTAKDVKLHEDKTIYTLIGPNDIEKEIVLNMAGQFTVYNSLAVICTCYALNMDIDEIILYLRNLKSVSGRFEKVENNKGLNVFVDYAHTPDALDNVLKSVKSFVKGNIITVFGCGGNREKGKRPIMGSIAQKYSDLVIITSDNPRFEEPEDIINDIVKGIDKNKENYLIIEDRKEAIKKAIESATTRDVVLIAGKGHENYQIIKDKVLDFDDKKIAKEIIEKEAVQ
ncbi:MAG: UDP-N-acetylmuramoyl-L-alanyl-D-glutamate--2,6-diaminopimelate ligase [Terrisporobacter sp.]